MEAIDWAAFAEAAPEIARAGHRLLRDNEVAFLASVTARGRPRLHPFVPRIVDGRLVAFIMDSSPKLKDLSPTGHYALHAWPGSEDEEFVIGLGSGDFRWVEEWTTMSPSSPGTA